MTELDDDTRSSDPQGSLPSATTRAGWLKRTSQTIVGWLKRTWRTIVGRRKKLWRDSLEARLMAWAGCSVVIALLPILIALAIYPTNGSSWTKLQSVVARGELLLIVTSVAAPAIGDAVVRKSNLARLRTTIVLASVLVSVYSAAIFGAIASHNQEIRMRREATEATMMKRLDSAMNEKSQQVQVRMSTVEASKYLEAHKTEDAVWTRPDIVAHESYMMLALAVLMGLLGVLFAEGRK